jgi:hypothetical protein
MEKLKAEALVAPADINCRHKMTTMLPPFYDTGLWAAGEGFGNNIYDSQTCRSLNSVYQQAA